MVSIMVAVAPVPSDDCHYQPSRLKSLCNLPTIGLRDVPSNCMENLSLPLLLLLLLLCIGAAPAAAGASC